MEQLFQDNEAVLEQVVATSLRRLRESANQAQLGTTVPTHQTDRVPSVNYVPATKSTASVGTNTQLQLLRTTVKPLMNIQCQRPQRGLLGPVPGSPQWQYCRTLLTQLLRQSRSRR